jgi:sugar transferase EpsL
MPRIVDLLLLALIAPLAVPLAVVIALAVLLSLGRPVLFSQPRGGYRGSIFSIYKFRTMTNDRDASGALLPDHVRLTRIGRFLRATSLDELPSLLNLLRGDMRIVGPRPFIADYLPLYSAEQYRRHDVRPGITGWAQVNGRNALTWEEKFALDTWYVDHRSFWLDVKILVLTVRNVLRRDGINAAAEVTMPRFAGTKE